MSTKIVDEHIFDSFLKEPNIGKWAEMNPDFPDVMWKLHFEMDCGESYNKLFPEHPHSHSELEQYKVILENLNTVDTKVYGNFVFSEWRYLTHWSNGFYDQEAAAYFFQHALPTLVEKMNSYELSTLITDPSPFDRQEEQSSSDAGSAENNYMSFSEVYKRAEEEEREAFIHTDKKLRDFILSKLA